MAARHQKSVWPMFVGLVILGAACAVFGVYLIWLGISSLGTYMASGGWDRVDATILEVELKTHRTARTNTRNSRRKTTTTYSVACQYEYTLDGTTYQGDRVAIMKGSSSDRAFHQARYDALKRHKDGGEPFSAYADPANPEEAILFREASVLMYLLIPLGLLCLGGSALFPWLGLAELRHIRKERALREAALK
jgi:hypothetical protein